MKKNSFRKVLIGFLLILISSVSVGAVTQDEEDDDAKMYSQRDIPLSDLTPKGICLEVCFLDFKAPMQECIMKKRKEREESKKSSDQTTASECRAELYSERKELGRCSRACDR